MKHQLVRAVATATLLAAACTVAAARAQGDKPAQGGITVPQEELKLYQPIPKAATAAEAITLAKAFVAKYPKSAAIPQVEIDLFNKILDSPLDATRVANTATFREMYPDSDHGLLLERSLADYYLQQQNFAEIKRVSDAYLAKHPDDVRTHVLLGQVGVEGAKRGDATLVQSGIEHSTKAISLLEGAKPADFATEEDWQKYKTDNLGAAYQSRGILAVATSDVKNATEYLTKATQAKPTDPLNYLFLASIKEGEYEPLAKAYNAAIDKESAASKQKLEAANAVVDQLIPLYAKAVVNAQGQAQYAGVEQSARQALEQYYKLRHDGKLDGIEKVLADAKGGAK